MRISVRFNGKVFEVAVEEEQTTLQHLCNAIEHATGVLARYALHSAYVTFTVSHSNQKLISKGKALTASSTPISATNIKEGSTIMLMASAAGTETQVPTHGCMEPHHLPSGPGSRPTSLRSPGTRRCSTPCTIPAH